ncbi:MAG: hypothetical protein DDT31_00204 [Syntrophomonadaceae bacterium]|nr:hypothetical protein [Bacillota bacterium]
MKGALLQDIRSEVERALREGKSREDFKTEFNQIVDRRGWSGDRDWRASIIYQTNLRQAYGDGRCRQMNDPDVISARPYRMWVHGDSRVPRPEHRAMNGKVFRADHPVAQTRLPSGFGCKCTWVSLSERDMKRRGLSVETGITWGSEIETAKGRKVLQIDRGFGAACRFQSEQEREERKAKARKDILARMPPGTQRDATKEILAILIIGGFFVGALSAKDAIFATFPNFLKFINDNLQKEVVDFRQQKHKQRADQYKQDLSQQIKTVGDQFKQPNTKPITIVVGGVGDADGKNAEFLVNQLLDNGLEGDVIFLNNQIPQINSVIKDYIISDPFLAPYAAYLQAASNLSNKDFAQFFASLPESAKLPFRNALLRLSKNLIEKSFESGVNQIPEILEQIIKSQSTSVNFVGHSGGGLVIEDLMQVLQDIGIKSKTGISLGGLRLPIKSAPKNLRRYYSDLDFVNTLFESDKDYGDLDRYFEGIYHSRSSAPKGKELFTWQTNKDVFDQMVADLNQGYVKPVKRSNGPQSVRKNKPIFDIEVSASEIPFDDLPDVTVTLPPAKVRELRKKLGLDVDSDRTLIPPMRDLPRDVSFTTRPPSDLVAPRDPILPPEPRTRPAPPATLEVRKITEDELSALRQSAKRDLPFRIRVNKNKDGTFNVQPVAGDGYKWTTEQAEIVGNYLRSKGVYLSDKFDPTNAGWQEGANYLKVAFDAELPFQNQPLGDLSIQTESQKTRAKAYTLQQGLKDTTDKIDAVKLDKERALERLATNLEIEEGNPFADEIAKKFDDQIKVLERRAKQQRSKIQGFILDADKFDEYERRAATTFDLQDNSSIGEGAADIISNSVRAQELQKEVKAAIDRLPQAQRELDKLQRIEDEIKLSKELIKLVVDERKAISRQQKELIKNIRILEADLNRGEGLIGGRSGRSLDALNQARSQLAAIEIRLPELERGENAYKGQREALQELLDQSVTSIPELNREIKGLQGEINAKSTELYNNIKLFQRLDRLKSANLGNDVPVSDGEKLDNIRVPIPEKPKPNLEKRYVRRAYADKYAAKIGGKVLVQKDQNGKTIYVVVPPGGITLDG